MAVSGLFWIELGLGLVLLFLTAKAHGRQIRLERELEGYVEVDFMKENPPWVEALWRKDRRRYWASLPAAIAVLSVAGLLTLPARLGTEPLNNPVLGSIVIAGFLWPFAVAFTSNGIQSAFRLSRALKEKPLGGPEHLRDTLERNRWVRSAVRGTTLYWGAVGAVGTIAALAAFV